MISTVCSFCGGNPCWCHIGNRSVAEMMPWIKNPIPKRAVTQSKPFQYTGPLKAEDFCIKPGNFVPVKKPNWETVLDHTLNTYRNWLKEMEEK